MPFKEARRMESVQQSFEDKIASLDPETKKAPRYLAIVTALDEDGDYAKATRELKKFLLKRGAAMDNVSIVDAGGQEIPRENILKEFDNIRIAEGNSDAFLGNGAVAEVFSMLSCYKRQQVCVKLVKDDKKYAEGNSVAREYSFLVNLRKTEVAGVRTPTPYYFFSTIRMKGYTMEQLEAVNLRRVIEGQTTAGKKDVLPDNFDCDDFFRRCREYLAHMHSMGIFHGDIALRNLMVNSKTGYPYLIDFGKGRYDIELDKTNLSAPDFAKNDLALLHAAEQEMHYWLKEQGVKR